MKYKVKLIVIIFLCFSICFASNHIALAELTLYELRADYDQFWDIIEVAMPFYPLLGDDESLRKLKETNKQLIGSRIKNINGLYTLLNSTIQQMNPAAHFEMIDPLFYENYKQIAINYSMPEARLIFDPQTMATYKTLAKSYTNTSFSLNEKPIQPQTYYYKDIKTAYIRFSSFSTNMVDPNLDSPVVLFLEDHSDTKHLIIDITGSSGGNSNYWLYYIASAFSKKYSWNIMTFIKLSLPISWLYNNMNLESIDNLDSSEIPKFVKEYNMTHYGKYTITFPLEEYRGKQLDSSVKIWLLVDGLVFSAADSLSRFCKDTGFATLVGTTTRGGGSAIKSPAVCRLNHSGLLFRFDVISCENENKLPSDIEGIAPDILTLPGLSPLET